MYLEDIYIPLGTVYILITFNLLKMMIEVTLIWHHVSTHLWVAIPSTNDTLPFINNCLENMASDPSFQGWR